MDARRTLALINGTVSPFAAPGKASGVFARDGVGEVVSATPENASVRWRFRVPKHLSRFIAAKGSVAIDGVSLTVNEVDGDVFGVNIIPHTASITTFGTLQPGDRVNIEADMMARYVARLQESNR